MNRMRSRLNLLAAFVVCALLSSLAQAQATRTWVSGVGDDANPCSRTAPCKTFAGAISKTAAGGEISVLDPGGFGAVTITKAITINGEGTLAGILAAGTNGVIVNAGVNDIVVLRNISINGAGTGINGIRYLAGKHLIVENCWIQGFSNHGIDVIKSSAGILTVKDSHITNCAQVGVRLSTTVGTITGLLDNVRIQACSIGVDALQANVTINRSAISQMVFQCVVSEQTSVINAEGCILANSGTGISANNSGATIRISNCDIFNNGTGVNVAAGGIGDTFVNNRIRGNSTNVSGTLSNQAQQ